jgi:glycosyltransferase involved in cell wall biosynthesis
MRYWLSQYIYNRKKKIPVVVSLESMKHGRPEEFFVRFVASQIINFMPGQLCTLSIIEYTKMKIAGIRRSKLKLVPNWVDFKKFEENNHGQLPFEKTLNGKFIIVYLAQFVPRKGHFYLLKAAAKIVKDYPNCLFVLAGNGPLLPKICSLTNRLGLINHVIFPGRLTSEQVVVLLKRSDIAAIASLSETFGWTIVEPLMANKPVVTTAVGCALDLANINGVLMVPRRDANALAIALKHMIEDPELRENIVKQGKRYVLENCDINKVVDKYYSIYLDCV